MTEEIIQKGVLSVTTCKCGDYLKFDDVRRDGKRYHVYYCGNVNCDFEKFEVEQKRKDEINIIFPRRYEKIEL